VSLTELLHRLSAVGLTVLARGMASYLRNRDATSVEIQMANPDGVAIFGFRLKEEETP